jgi:hypothetical protein
MFGGILLNIWRDYSTTEIFLLRLFDPENEDTMILLTIRNCNSYVLNMLEHMNYLFGHLSLPNDALYTHL